MVRRDFRQGCGWRNPDSFIVSCIAHMPITMKCESTNHGIKQWRHDNHADLRHK